MFSSTPNILAVSLFLLRLFTLPSLSNALAPHSSSPRVFSMRMYRNDERRSILKKRNSPLDVTIGNAIITGLYFVNASVGTPPQLVQLQVDTGSSDVWMFGPDGCTSTSGCLGGIFDPSRSSSLTVISRGTFNISYDTPGSGVTGDYVADNFAIGGTTIQNLTMAVAKSAVNVPTGIMGIGFDTDESIVSNANSKPYPNLIDVMVQQNIINTRAYSLWLDDLEDSTGTVLFGGYDTDKFSGDLAILKIYPDAQSGTISSMTVAWTSLSVTDSSGTTTLDTGDFPLPAVLDSGTTLTVVPSDIYSQLATYFEVISDQTYGALVSCSISSIQGTLNYGFGGSNGPVISVSYSELALPAFDGEGNPLTFDDNTAACSFGISPVGQGESILLGDTFLRSAYVVYDLDAQQIGIAPTVFNSTSSNIKEIGSGNVADASSVATGPSVEQTATGIMAPGLAATGSASQVQTTVPTGHVGSLTGVKTTQPATGSATATTATPTKNAAPSPSTSFNLVGVLAIVCSFFMMSFGGVLLIFD